jgi:hypothetical protein
MECPVSYFDTLRKAMAFLERMIPPKAPVSRKPQTSGEKVTWPREECLDLVKIAVVARGTAYGKPEDLFARIAQRWSLTLGAPVSARQVAVMMMDMKIERALADTGADHPIDIAGYAACLYEIDRGDQ